MSTADGLHTELLLAAPFSPSDDLIVRQLALLSDEVDRCDQPHQEQRREILAAQYRALMWARSPDAFAPPMKPAHEHR